GRPVVAEASAAAGLGLAQPPSPGVFDYRYHAVSLAAVLLALAVGIVIGVAIGDSNLVSSAKSGIVRDLSSEVGAAQRQTSQLRAQLAREEAVANDLYAI